MPKKKSTSNLHHVELAFPMGVSRTVKVRAASREVAEKRALKRNPSATGVKQRG